MTGKERINHILDKCSGNEIAWTSWIDEITVTGMSEEIQKKNVLEINQLAGLDTLQFGSYGLGELGIIFPFEIVNPEVHHTHSKISEDMVETTTHSPWGTLTMRASHSHPVKYPVQSLEELRTFTEIQRHATCEEASDNTYETQCQKAFAVMGDSGIYCSALTCSPVQELLQHTMGVEMFNYLLMDHPQEVQVLLDVMHQLKLQEVEILCRRSPSRCIVPVENTSTALISPTQYRQYSVPQLRAYAEIIHKHDKMAIWHMCGHLNNLLPIFPETDLDGINAMTPPPVGNTHFEDALDILGEDFMILGGLMSPLLFQKPDVTRDELWRELDRIYTPRIRKSNFLLHIPSGAIPLPLERFHIIRDWFEANR